jgi:hypothetical protein
MLKKKTNILSAEGQRAAPGFVAERFKKLGYSNVGNALTASNWEPVAFLRTYDQPCTTLQR